MPPREKVSSWCCSCRCMRSWRCSLVCKSICTLRFISCRARCTSSSVGALGEPTLSPSPPNEVDGPSEGSLPLLAREKTDASSLPSRSTAGRGGAAAFPGTAAEAAAAAAATRPVSALVEGSSWSARDAQLAEGVSVAIKVPADAPALPRFCISSRYFCRCDLMFCRVGAPSPSHFIIWEMACGLAWSMPRVFTAVSKRRCSSAVHTNRCLCACRPPSALLLPAAAGLSAPPVASAAMSPPQAPTASPGPDGQPASPAELAPPPPSPITPPNGKPPTPRPSAALCTACASVLGSSGSAGSLGMSCMNCSSTSHETSSSSETSTSHVRGLLDPGAARGGMGRLVAAIRAQPGQSPGPRSARRSEG
mmetsp:Transcript_28696/g.94352  ORF Transcript_28696/g.94352 Transcript_28696/m.94352 type:complete len:364 (-) Transcript_28696:28-1119(-)